MKREKHPVYTRSAWLLEANASAITSTPSLASLAVFGGGALRPRVASGSSSAQNWQSAAPSYRAVLRS